MEQKRKELHVLVSANQHKLFLAKAKEDGNASQKIRIWIKEYLDGEKT